jgi:hypothetical protein
LHRDDGQREGSPEHISLEGSELFWHWCLILAGNVEFQKSQRHFYFILGGNLPVIATLSLSLTD